MPSTTDALRAAALAGVLLVVQLTAVAAESPATAASTPRPLRVMVQRSPLAGFRHHAAAALWPALRVGDPLTLVREPHNPYDANAIAVAWRGERLGYVPRRENAALAWALDRGEAVDARIVELREHPNPRERLRFEVYAD